jgi:hypothetical protein
MIIYFTLLALIMLLLYTSGKLKGSKSSDLGIYVSVILLILFAGLRNKSVGTDTGGYVYYFERGARNFFVSETMESGFLLLETVAASISLSYWSLLTLIAVLSIFAYVYAIKKLTLNIPLSFFLYITLAAYIFFFNGARQGIAASIFAVALVFLLKRKLIWYLVWIFIASLFHKTILIMLPFYFILQFKYSTVRMVLFAVLSFVGLTFLSFFLSFLDEGQGDKYSAYVDRGASGGYLLGLFFFFIAIVLIYFRKIIPIQAQKTYDIYLNLCVFNALIYVVVIAIGVDVNFLRFSQYFLVGYVMIWPIIFKYAPIAKYSLFKVAFYMLHLGFYAIYLLKMSDMIPFVFNTELFI